MTWKKVKVVAEPGTEFGIVSDDDGTLVLAVRPEGREWPCEEPAARNVIQPGCSRYVVVFVEDEVEQPT